MKPRLVLLERGTYSEQHRSALEEEFEVVIPDTSTLRTTMEVIQQHQPAAIVVGLGLMIDEALLGASTNLRWVVSPTTGIDHIDLTQANRMNVRVLTLRDLTSEISTVSSTAELAWGLVLALARRLTAAHQSVIEGNWDRTQFEGVELRGKTIGVVGLGRLGSYVAQYALGFGMKVLAFDVRSGASLPAVECVGLSELVSQAHVISLHVPFAPDTEHLIDQSLLGQIKHKALLINTSRGQIVDESAVARAIRDGALGGYGADVLAGERAWGSRVEANPLTPLITEGFNVIITPHIGGYTTEAIQHTRGLIVREFLARYRQEQRRS